MNEDNLPHAIKVYTITGWQRLYWTRAQSDERGYAEYRPAKSRGEEFPRVYIPLGRKP